MEERDSTELEEGRGVVCEREEEEGEGVEME